MKTASITETKNNLSALLDQVQQGQTILIMDRNRPVARLEPVTKAGKTDVEGRMERLVRAGLARRPQETLDVQDFLKRSRPKVCEGGSVLAALLEERREGR